MRKMALFLLFLPVAGFTQTLTLNAGPSFSTIVPPKGVGRPAGLENVITGLSASGGLSFAERDWGFLSINAGVVQKGRRDKSTYIDGNDTHTKINRVRFSYATVNMTANLKLSSGSLVPFVSVGPRVDYFIDQPEATKLPAFLYGANAGIGLMQYAGNWRYGVRADYLYNFTKKPNDRTATLMAFVGWKVSKIWKRVTPCPRHAGY